MALETLMSRMGLDTTLTERYADYSAPVHDQNIFYGNEQPSSQHGNGIPSKYHYPTDGYKGNAAMSALTLLAFLFFLHILQQCLKDHMTAIGTPQIMIMTAGKEEQNIAKLSQINKFDKTGTLRNGNDLQTEINVKEIKNNSDYESKAQTENVDFTSPKTLLKIKTAEHRPENGVQKYKIINKNENTSLTFGNFYKKFNN